MYYILILRMCARCVLYYNTILARGPLRAPVASLRPWLFQGIEPIPEPPTVSPVEHEQGLETCLSTCTEPCTNVWPSDHQSGERIAAAPDTPIDHFMETRKGAFHS